MSPTLHTTTPPAVTHTLGDWRVKTGAETAFVHEWTQFNEWLHEYPGVESLVLIQDEHDPGHFISLGAWSDGGSTAPWPTFLERLGRCQALCEASRSHAYKLAVVPSEAEHTRRLDRAA